MAAISSDHAASIATDQLTAGATDVQRRRDGTLAVARVLPIIIHVQAGLATGADLFSILVDTVCDTINGFLDVDAAAAVGVGVADLSVGTVVNELHQLLGASLRPQALDQRNESSNMRG